MNIALIAHDKKKELMVQFCIAYCGILSKHSVCATGTTGKMVSDVVGLDVFRFMSGAAGGYQQIASRIAYDEIDMLIFFRDFYRRPRYRCGREHSAEALRYAQYSLRRPISLPRRSLCGLWSAAIWSGAKYTASSGRRRPKIIERRGGPCQGRAADGEGRSFL